MTTLTRRRRPSDDMPDEERNTPAPDDDAPRRRSRRSRADEDEAPARRSRKRDDDEDDTPPTRRGRGRRSEAADEDAPSRSKGRRGGRGSRGFDSYKSKRKSNSKFADEFKPSKDNTPSLIKLLDAEPFDSYNQHWVEEGDASGKTRHSFVCYDDEEYFPDADKGCPLCAVGYDAQTYSLWNVLNLENPRKPVVEVWKTSATVTDKLERMADSKRTTPLDREDLYLEVTRVKKGRKISFDIESLKDEDAGDEYDFDPFTKEELAEFEDSKFDDRSSITQVDDWDELDDLAASTDE